MFVLPSVRGLVPAVYPLPGPRPHNPGRSAVTIPPGDVTLVEKRTSASRSRTRACAVTFVSPPGNACPDATAADSKPYPRAPGERDQAGPSDFAFLTVLA